MTALSEEVYLLFARCVLRLQALELRSKAMVARSRLSGPVSGIEDAMARREAETRRMTLWPLMGEMVGSVVVPAGQGEAEEAPRPKDDPAYFGIWMRVEVPAEDFARIEAELRDLVVLRNGLVHHFLEQHDLRSEAGCLAARAFLTEALARITRVSAEVREWAEHHERLGQAFGEMIADPEVRKAIFGTRRMLQALQEAAGALAPGGWAKVAAAVEWIAQHYPEESPERYGCKSWRQVIRETGRFDLRVDTVAGRDVAVYRLREAGA